MPTAIGRSALHFDRLLTDIAIEAWDSQDGQFIGDQVLPSVMVDKQSDIYAVIEPDGFFREYTAERAPMAKSNAITWSVSSGTYYARNYALQGRHALEDLINADTAFRLRENTARAVVMGLKRARESRIASTVTSGTNVGSYVALSGATKWSATDSADILGQVNSAHAFIRSRTGMIPNTLVIDWDSLQVCRRNAQLLRLFSPTNAGQLPLDWLQSQVFQVDRILVGRAVKNVAAQGKTTSMTSVWGNNALLAYIDPSPGGLQTQTFGLSFDWQAPHYPANLGVKRAVYADAGEANVEVVEAGHYQDHQIVARDLAYLISATI